MVFSWCGQDQKGPGGADVRKIMTGKFAGVFLMFKSNSLRKSEELVVFL